MPEGFHPAIEEYLHAVYELEEDGIPVIRARLAERLEYSAPSVTQMVRRLIDEGYLVVADKSLQLTPGGRTIAESVVRKHRLAERLLTDIIGLDWYKSHSEAGRWEHVISEEVEARLIEILEKPETCPHGNPIPGLSGIRPKLETLESCDPGRDFRVERVAETLEMDLEAVAYLDRHGMRPGAVATVVSRAPDGTILARIDGNTISLSGALAAEISGVPSG